MLFNNVSEAEQETLTCAVLGGFALGQQALQVSADVLETKRLPAGTGNANIFVKFFFFY